MTTAKSPLGLQPQTGFDVIPVYRDSLRFPFGNYSAPFELKTYGSNRADLLRLPAVSGKVRFRNIRPDFPFGKRMPSPVSASGSARLPLVSAAAVPLPDDASGVAKGDGAPDLSGQDVIDPGGRSQQRRTGNLRPTAPGRRAFPPGQIARPGTRLGPVLMSYPCTGIDTGCRNTTRGPFELETGVNRETRAGFASNPG